MVYDFLGPSIEKKLKFNSAWIIAIIFAAIAQVAHLQFLRESAEQPFSTGFIVKPEVARAVALGYDRLVADFYWLVFLQYYGDRRSASEDLYVHAPDYLKLIIALDPHFTRAYWYVSFVLAGDLGHSVLSTPEECARWRARAKELLDYGIKQNPDSWDLPYIAAFNQYLYEKNQDEAANYYTIASKMKNAPPFLARMARAMKRKATEIETIINEAQTLTDAAEYGSGPSVRNKNREAARFAWSQIYYNKNMSAEYKDMAVKALEQLDTTLISQDELKQLATSP